ncbi:hypothetical protein HZS_1270 [Henneguya salminicola]|nr:hypothetical protein HZS_1270 [Henneguya salminicola]
MSAIKPHGATEGMTPHEMQRVIVETLMEDPNKKDDPAKEVDIYEEYVRPPDPPDFIRQAIGSNSGAGSGEFHIYRMQRKFEHKRVRYFEHQLKEEKAQLEFDANKKMLAQMETEKTAERRMKRYFLPSITELKNERKKEHRKFAEVISECTCLSLALDKKKNDPFNMNAHAQQ